MQESFLRRLFRQNLQEESGRIFLSRRKVVVTIMTADTYLQRGQQKLEHFLNKPAVSLLGWTLGYGIAGFLLSAASIRQTFQPVAMGAVCGLSGGQAMAMAAGAMMGYRIFWGQAGLQGAVWTAAGALLALVIGKRKQIQAHPLVISMAASALVSCLGLIYQLVFRQEVDFFTYALQVAVAGGAAALSHQVHYHRDSMTDWMAGGVFTLALSQLVPLPYLSLGYLCCGLIGSTGPFPAAALAGLGLDLSGITRVPMAAVMCIAYLLRMIPFSQRWLRYLSPAAACLGFMAMESCWDPGPIPGLILGGGIGMLLPAKPQCSTGRGPTGAAQVRLELSSGVMTSLGNILRQQQEPEVDEEALAQKAKLRACGNCTFRKSCREREKIDRRVLRNPLDFTCRKTGRLLMEIGRSQEQMKVMNLERKRREEFRTALIQQYWFLSHYLQDLADQMPRRTDPVQPSFTLQVAARSHGKQRENGDKCIAFSGIGCRYYVLLCDGMGTGAGAAEESRNAEKLIYQMLVSGLPAQYVLQTINSVLSLQGKAGAFTVDLVELRLDTGKAALYKWGAAPSWLVRGGKAEKIGTATPPPGISVTETREAVDRLSLRRGEVLILTSDGVDGEAALRRMVWAPDAPPGELAEKLLEHGCSHGADDETTVVLRLRPASLVT